MESKEFRSVVKSNGHQQFEKCDRKENELIQKEYEPYIFGNIHNGIDYWDTVIHLVRVTIGTGILILPYAFHTVGYGIGILGTLFIGLLYVNNVHSLLFTEYRLCKELKVPNLTYVSVVDKTFKVGPSWIKGLGPYFKYLLYFYYGLPTGNAIYLIIMGQNLNNIYGYYFEKSENKTWTGSSYMDENGDGQSGDIHLKYSISIVIIPLILLCLIPKLKLLVPLSALTNFFTLINIAIIFSYSLHFDQWKYNGQLIGDLNYVPQFFAIVLQSLIATGIILPLKNDMYKPKQFASACGVLNVSFVLLILLYICFGVVVSLNYGKAIHQNVLRNLPSDELLTLIIHVLYTLALFVTYTLVFYIYYDTIWMNLLQEKVLHTPYEKLTKYFLRICVNVVAYLMAILVPNFALYTSLIGSVGIILEISLPSILQLTLIMNSKCKPFVFVYYLLKNTIIILISFIMFIMSIKSCIFDIIRLYV
ncbi:hypothetical protein PGB90_009798 [Kerria lacca]